MFYATSLQHGTSHQCVGLGGGLLLVLVALYFKVLRKKNIETGQKSAVMMTRNVLVAAPVVGSR